ncbi:MAG: hypothetical protein JO048_02755 [Methylobacteriaceae bacterium]|nr:hypothetical protein [Methylobacteriaceae bacterium]
MVLSALGRAALALSLLAGPVLVSALPSTADAKAYYTRKRVNGRWVNGHFGKASWTALPAAAATGSTAAAAETPIPPAREGAPGQPAPAAASEAPKGPLDHIWGEHMTRLHSALQDRARAIAVGLMPSAAASD